MGTAENEHVCSAQFLPEKTCLAEFSKFTNFQLLGKRVFVVRKWFPWDLDVFIVFMDVSANQVLFKHSHAHLFIYCLCPHLCYNRRVWL